jgi:hypothetical protein
LYGLIGWAGAGYTNNDPFKDRRERGKRVERGEERREAREREWCG